MAGVRVEVSQERELVVGAVGVAADQNILWFGTQANQTTLASDIVVASQVYKWEVIRRGSLDNIDNGTLGGSTYKITLENDGLVVEYNDGYDLPGDVKDLADETIDGIKDGSISTG